MNWVIIEPSVLFAIFVKDFSFLKGVRVVSTGCSEN